MLSAGDVALVVWVRAGPDSGGRAGVVGSRVWARLGRLLRDPGLDRLDCLHGPAGPAGFNASAAAGPRTYRHVVLSLSDVVPCVRDCLVCLIASCA